MVKEITKFDSAVTILTPRLLNAVLRIPDIEARRIQDIRLRYGKSLSVSIFEKEYFVTAEGVLSNSDEKAVKICREDMEEVFNSAFKNSIHSFSREISKGYITIGGGNRVGFCGTAVKNPLRQDAVDKLKDISSINIRVAREIIGAGEDIFNRVFAEGDKSLLLVGPPCSGKTTVLRDLCRKLGNSKRISLIDERNEISASCEGLCGCNVGRMTDVFCSYDKYDGIMTAVKVMAPNYLVCDEIGSKEDSAALEYAINSGVCLVCTVHAPDFEEAKKRVTVSKLIKDGVFDYAAVLGKGPMCGKLIRLVKINSK